ncbi:MAG: hypothetical protein CMC05_09110 [Flavobacteriaceae bacterium]|nr:hypothetical protein [Flavobacteriaceae bacterium]MBD10979.1 hypothetical protein [Flavobacteriaceae bacterium]|tara:strand:- start:18487 stop:18870 length:384 start_codon:yes stop_codon:yes gene_type:complete
MSSNPIFKNKPYEVEQLKMSKHSFSVKVNVITGQDGDFWVAISPSLNISGYGETKEEAQESFHHHISTFWDELKSLKMDKRHLVLKNLGWNNKFYAKRQYSKAFVDENGDLQGLESAQINSLQTETA